MPIGDSIKAATQRQLAAQRAIKEAARQIREEEQNARPGTSVARGAPAQR